MLTKLVELVGKKKRAQTDVDEAGTKLAPVCVLCVYFVAVCSAPLLFFAEFCLHGIKSPARRLFSFALLSQKHHNNKKKTPKAAKDQTHEEEVAGWTP